MHILAIIGRVAAGCVAALAFYTAFFMYEDDQGIWQNRIDNLWIEIYDRAKLTHSATIALFNKIAERLSDTLNRLFGPSLVSAKSVGMSIALSIAGASTATALVLFHIISASNPKAILICLSLALIPMAVVILALQLPRPWNLFASATVTLALLVAFCWVVYGLESLGDIPPNHPYAEVVEVITSAVLLSFLSDIVAVVAIRRLFAIVAKTLSSLRIVGAICALIAIPILIQVSLFSLYLTTESRLAAPSSGPINEAIILAFALNLATIIYCVIPALMLISVLLHRLSWPFASKIMYPFCRYTIVSNRIALIAAGSFCLILAIHPAALDLEKILKFL